MENACQIIKHIESQIAKADHYDSFEKVKVSLTDDKSRLRSIEISGIDGSVYRSVNLFELLENLDLSKNGFVTIKSYSAAIKILEDLKKIIDCSNSKISVNYRCSDIEIKNETGTYWIDVYSYDEEDSSVVITCEMKQIDDVLRSVTTYHTDQLVKLEEIEDVIKLIESKKGN